MSIRRRVLPRSGLALSEIGFGAAPLGNLYRPVSDEDARAALAAALQGGITYIDTAPHYGHGLSERRVGDALRGARNVVLSTKVGRLFRPEPRYQGTMTERHGFCSPMPFERVYNYTRDGVLRAYEDSLQRLGLARVDILFVHDIGRLTHHDDHRRTFAELTTGGGLRALEELRAAGAISGFGVGVNECEACDLVMDHADLDVLLIAGRYSLLDQVALTRLLPRCIAADTAVVVGGAYNSGILATGTRSEGTLYYDYAPANAAIIERVRALEGVCDEYGVPLAAAALHFPLGHPAVASVVLGLGSAHRVGDTIELYETAIPVGFWHMLIDRGLIDPAAPIPETAT